MKYFILNIKFWIIGNIKKYFPFIGNYFRTTTSIITINQKLGIVDKEVIQYKKYNIVDNEVHWLNKLHDFKHTPTVINRNKNKITLSYAGEPLTSKNIPDNWQEQINVILKKLKEINCSHNDIKPSNLLLLNNNLMLIDFQWANYEHEEIPSDWPKSIGGRYKHPKKIEDNYSILKSIKSIVKSKT